MNTLALNNAYMPIGTVPWTQAVGDILIGRAEVVDTYEDRTVRSGLTHEPRNLPTSFYALSTAEVGVWKVPSIIRYLTAAIFRKRQVKFNRHNIWLRDKGQCQYCSVKLRTDEFTYDHVFPQSRGGQTAWENIVVACIPCNHKKGSKTTQEARMSPLREPKRPVQLPGQLSPALAWKEGMPESWQTFLGSVRFWHQNLD